VAREQIGQESNPVGLIGLASRQQGRRERRPTRGMNAILQEPGAFAGRLIVSLARGGELIGERHQGNQQCLHRARPYDALLGFAEAKTQPMRASGFGSRSNSRSRSPLHALARGPIGDFVRISLCREHRPNLGRSHSQQFDRRMLRPTKEKGLDHRELHIGAWVIPGDHGCKFDTLRAAPHDQLDQNIAAHVLRQSGKARRGIRAQH
jgi:hypothetical protein